MASLYLGVLAVSGLFVGVLVSAFVHVDTGRRGLSGARRLLLAAGVGVGCLGGFLAPYAFESHLKDAYFRVIKPRPIAVSPVEWLAVSLVTGLLISAIAVGLYLAGVRYGTPEPTSAR